MNTALSGQKLKMGDKFPAMSLTTTKGKELSIPVSGAKFTHVQFQRFSGCPICDTTLLFSGRHHKSSWNMAFHEVLFFIPPVRKYNPSTRICLSMRLLILPNVITNGLESKNLILPACIPRRSGRG
jgi:hypothetical protein